MPGIDALPLPLQQQNESSHSDFPPSDSQSQLDLNGPPSDSISTLKFVSLSDQYLIASSWDGTVRLFDIQTNTIKYIYQSEDPILGCTAKEPSRAFFGGLDEKVSMIDFNTSQVTYLGDHDDAVRCMDYSDISGSGIVISGSWDSSIKLWDSRTLYQIGSYDQVDEVFCLSCLNEILVVGTAENHISVWDLRNMKSPIVERVSKMPDYQSRCLSIHPEKMGYALGSINGRVSFESFKGKNELFNDFVCRAHVTKTLDGVSIYHPVNAISFHTNGYFATGGSEGQVSIWNPTRQTKVQTYSTYPSGVATLDFSYNGKFLAIGCSYLHDQVVAPSSANKNRIFVRQVKFQNWL